MPLGVQLNPLRFPGRFCDTTQISRVSISQIKQSRPCLNPEYNNPKPPRQWKIRDTPFGSGNSCCRKRKRFPIIWEIDFWDYDWSGLVHQENMHSGQRLRPNFVVIVSFFQCFTIVLFSKHPIIVSIFNRQRYYYYFFLCEGFINFVFLYLQTNQSI